MKNYKQIGKGSFSTVYRKGNDKDVLIISTDPVKECMSLDWFPESRLFPKVKRISCNEDGSQTYVMKYYGKVTAPKRQLNKRAYALYKELKNLSVLCLDENLMYEKWILAFNSLSNRFKNVIEVLQDAVDALTNYGPDICFEISPRNIAATKSGNLVLLDCFFLRSELRKVKKKLEDNNLI